MVGITARRTALMTVLAVLAFSLGAAGLSGHVRAVPDPSPHVAAVQSALPAPGPTLRRQASAGDWKVRADRAGGGRGAPLLVLAGFLWLLGLGAGSVHRAPHPAWVGLTGRRHSISLRGPPALGLI